MTTTSKIRLSANVKAVRRARELSRVSRQELGLRLGISHKAIEKIENGRTKLSEKRLLEILEALNLKMSDLIGIKKGRGLLKGKPKKKVITNKMRRSYTKMITKECQVLKSMRKQKNISQDNASKLCGYARATIGHIENGRIELSKERIDHIIKSYGHSWFDFEEEINKEETRDQVIEACVLKINKLDDSKLSIVKNLLGSL